MGRLSALQLPTGVLNPAVSLPGTEQQDRALTKDDALDEFESIVFRGWLDARYY